MNTIEYNIKAINALISPFTVTAAGLATLGIEAASRGAARLYSEDDVRTLLLAMINIGERGLHK